MHVSCYVEIWTLQRDLDNGALVTVEKISRHVVTVMFDHMYDLEQVKNRFMFLKNLGVLTNRCGHSITILLIKVGRSMPVRLLA